MDVHLIILDFTKHQKGFSVQRCETAVRGSLIREFGPAVPFVIYAPPWVASYISTPHQVEVARGVPDAIRFMTERIARLKQNNPHSSLNVVVASYNFYVRRAARQAGVTHGIAIGEILLADFANGFSPDRAAIDWVGSESNLVTRTRIAPATYDHQYGPQRPSAPAVLANTIAVNPAPAIQETATVAVAVNIGALETATPVASGDILPVAEPEKYPRSLQMRNCLLKAKMFNEKPVRDLLFTTIKQIVPRQLLQLSALRRTLAEESFPQSAFLDKAKWDSQVHFFCRLLVFSGALIGPSGPLVHGAGADGTEVKELSLSLENDAEAYLIDHIIKELGDVTEFEHCPLAHAVFRQFDSNADMNISKDRVAVLISKIADRVTLDEVGTYSHRQSKPSLRAVK